MFFRLLVVFIAIPLLELWLLVELTRRTSLAWTIGLVLLTGMAGTSLVRWQGIKAWRQIQQQLASGKSPSEAIFSGVLILVAGAMLLTPGMITDTVGLLLLIPPIRSIVARWLQKRVVAQMVSGASRNGGVWFTSYSTSFSSTPDPPTDAGERPSVRVIDPDNLKLG
ncbi:MAG: FxsA family protein [Planctomycetota bacterium]